MSYLDDISKMHKNHFTSASFQIFLSSRNIIFRLNRQVSRFKVIRNQYIGYKQLDYIKMVQDLQAFKRTVSLLQLFLHKKVNLQRFQVNNCKLRHIQKIGINFIAQLLTRMHYTIGSRLFSSCSIRGFQASAISKDVFLEFNLQSLGKMFCEIVEIYLKMFEPLVPYLMARRMQK